MRKLLIALLLLTLAPNQALAGDWHRDNNVSWYGPGFYGHRTACGQALTTHLIGVAHRTLPCGTLVEFRNPKNGLRVTAPVVDRGPYVTGRQWDLTGGLCVALRHCYTGAIDWRFVGKATVPRQLPSTDTVLTPVNSPRRLMFLS